MVVLSLNDRICRLFAKIQSALVFTMNYIDILTKIALLVPLFCKNADFSKKNAQIVAW
jgi:hypothetical protein